MSTGDPRPPLIWSSAAPFYATFTCPSSLTARPHVFEWPTEGLKAHLPELHTDPDLILPETEATLFHTLPTLRALALRAALCVFPGLSGIGFRRYSDTLSQIKWDIPESKWQKGKKLLIRTWVVTLPFSYIEVHNILCLLVWGGKTLNTGSVFEFFYRKYTTLSAIQHCYFICRTVSIHTAHILFPRWPAIWPTRRQHKRSIDPTFPLTRRNSV